MIKKIYILIRAFINAVYLAGLRKTLYVTYMVLFKRNDRSKQMIEVDMNKTGKDYETDLVNQISDMYVKNLTTLFNDVDEWLRYEVVRAILSWANVLDIDVMKLASLVKLAYDTENWTPVENVSDKCSREMQWLLNQNTNK